MIGAKDLYGIRKNFDNERTDVLPLCGAVCTVSSLCATYYEAFVSELVALLWMMVFWWDEGWWTKLEVLRRLDLPVRKSTRNALTCAVLATPDPGHQPHHSRACTHALMIHPVRPEVIYVKLYAPLIADIE